MISYPSLRSILRLYPVLDAVLDAVLDVKNETVPLFPPVRLPL